MDDLVLISKRILTNILIQCCVYRKLARTLPRNFNPFVLLFFLVLWLFLHIHYIYFFLSFIICRYHVSLYIRALVCISQEQKHSYITVVHLSKSGNLTLIQVYFLAHSPYSNVANCLSNVIFMVWGGFCFSGQGSSPESHTVVKCHVF